MSEQDRECAYFEHDDDGKLATCQFVKEQNYRTRLSEVGGLFFCPFHLPWSTSDLLDKYGRLIRNTSAEYPTKDKWKDDQAPNFISEVRNLIEKTSQRLNLNGTVVPGELKITNEAHYELSWRNGVFSKNFAFPGRVFHANLDFSGSRFLSDATFRNCTFRATSFKFVEFCANADFRATKFIEVNNFQDAKFNHSDFRSTEFRTKLIFVGSHHSGGCNFNEAIFKKRINFENSTFEGDFRFRAAKANDANAQCHECDFSSVSFGGKADFSNRVFVSTLNFDDASFSKAPQFHGSTIHEDTSFPSARRFLDAKRHSIWQAIRHQFAPQKQYYAAASRAYRSLRLQAEAIKAHDDEAMFWELELRTKRRSSSNLIKVFVSYIYDLVTHYGNNYIRPFVLWLVVLTVFALFAYPNEKSSIKSRFQSKFFAFSLQQTIRPFAVWTPEGEILFARIALNMNCAPLVQPSSLAIHPCAVSEARQPELTAFRAKATLQSLISLGLIALMLFAIRRTFRLP